RVASDIADRLRAWSLAYRVYREKGYADRRESGLWYGPHDRLDGTTTFIFEHGAETVAACTMVPDTAELGLPVDAIYPEEVAALRREGCRLCEMISLVNTVAGRAGQDVLHRMFLYV